MSDVNEEKKDDARKLHAGPVNVSYTDTKYTNVVYVRWGSLGAMVSDFDTGGRYAGYIAVKPALFEDGSVAAGVTLELDDIELEVLDKRAEFIEREVEAWRQKQVDAKLEAEKKEKEEKAKLSAYADIGREYARKMAALKKMDVNKQQKELTKDLYNAKDPELTAIAASKLKALGLELDEDLQKLLDVSLEQVVQAYLKRQDEKEAAAAAEVKTNAD